jgi:hypothetical protein
MTITKPGASDFFNANSQFGYLPELAIFAWVLSGVPGKT